MRLARARLTPLVPGLFALFVAAGVVPHDVLFVHVHDDDAPGHVHAWGAVAHEHHHHAHGIGLHAAEHDRAHAHTQSPSQLSRALAVATLTRVEAVAPVETFRALPSVVAPLPVRSARAPPPPRPV